MGWRDYEERGKGKNTDHGERGQHLPFVQLKLKIFNGGDSIILKKCFPDPAFNFRDTIFRVFSDQVMKFHPIIPRMNQPKIPFCIQDQENRLFYGPDLVNRPGDCQGVMVHFEGSAGQGGKNKILPQIVPGVRDHNHSPFSSGMGLIRSITTNRFPPCIRPKSTQSPLIKALCTLNFFLPL